VKRVIICSKEGPGSFPGEIITKMQNRGDHLKIFSRSTEPEELIFTRKLSDIMYM
jgi:hypothetical protein